ncbi:MAG: hypothetical protein AAGA17_21310 [Actinomycetota bacterium]
MRSRWWFVPVVVAVMLAACGGGGDSADGGTFCAQLEAVAGDGEVVSLDDPDDAAAAVESIRRLADAAPSEIEDDVRLLTEIVEQLAELDPDDEEAGLAFFGELVSRGEEFEAADARIDRFAIDECGLELPDDTNDADAATDSVEPDEDADAGSALDGVGDAEVTGPIDTYGDDPGFDALWDECAAGDLSSCDTLWLTTPIGSEYERFGSTCGGISEETRGNCDGDDEVAGPSDYGDDPALDALWDGCEAGALADCDRLYSLSGIGTAYETFGATCGGRSDGGFGFCDDDGGGAATIDTYGDDPALDVLWDSCAVGELADCDRLYLESPFGSGYETFGSTCGERGEEARGRCTDAVEAGPIDTYGDDAALDVLWDECEAGEGDACDELYFISPLGSGYERFGSTCGDTRAETQGSCSLIGEGDAFGYGDDPVLDVLWDDCENGDGQACDDLYFDAPIGSDYEFFGETCGDRVEEGGPLCAEQIGVG